MFFCIRDVLMPMFNIGKTDAKLMHRPMSSNYLTMCIPKLYDFKTYLPTSCYLISCKCSVTRWLYFPMYIHNNCDVVAKKQLVGVLHHFTLRRGARLQCSRPSLCLPSIHAKSRYCLARKNCALTWKIPSRPPLFFNFSVSPC